MSGGGGPRRWPGLCVLLLSCAARPEPAPKAHRATNDGAPVPTASAVAVSSRGPEAAPSSTAPIASTPPVPVAAPTPAVASAPPSSEPVVAPAPPPKSGPPAVPCKSVQDCWVSAKQFPATPIARPKHLVGKAFKPCVDGEVAPTCTVDHVCGLLGYDC